MGASSSIGCGLGRLVHSIAMGRTSIGIDARDGSNGNGKRPRRGRARRKKYKEQSWLGVMERYKHGSAGLLHFAPPFHFSPAPILAL